MLAYSMQDGRIFASETKRTLRQLTGGPNCAISSRTFILMATIVLIRQTYKRVYTCVWGFNNKHVYMYVYKRFNDIYEYVYSYILEN